MTQPKTDEALKLLSRNAGGDIDASVAALKAAALAREPDGPRYLALLAAAGVGMPQSWARALDYLLEAALLGSSSAADQLTVLAGEGPPSPSLDRCSERWHALRRSVDLARWSSPCVKRVLQASPRIVAIENFLPSGAAAWLTRLAEGRLAPTLVYGGAEARKATGRTNTAFEFAFVDCDMILLLTRRRIAETVGVPVTALESSQILHYDPGQVFARHYDWLDPADPALANEIAQRGQRIITFLVYLNDDFSGGETQFPMLDVSHRGGLGDALYFGNIGVDGAPDRRTLHAGATPTQGEKWVFSQWIRNIARM